MSLLDTLTCGVSTILAGVLVTSVYGVINYQPDRDDLVEDNDNMEDNDISDLIEDNDNMEDNDISDLIEDNDNSNKINPKYLNLAY